jgi:hypothetical protein
MKAPTRYILLLTLAVTLTSAGVHKFYVAVFQLEYVPAKKVVQMTSRIFIDDLDAALTKKYGKKLYLCTPKEASDTDDYLKKYFEEKISIKLNGTAKTVKFLGRETEDDILVCYYTIQADAAVKSMYINNTVLFDAYPEQQNIIHTKVNGQKKSLMLTTASPTGTTEF